MNNQNKAHNISTPQIGGSYSTDQGFALDKICLQVPNSSVTKSDTGSSSLALSSSLTYSQFSGYIMASGGASLDILIAWGDISAAFLLAAEGGLYSQSYYFAQSMTFPTQVFNPVGFGTAALSEVGMAAYDLGSSVFRLICGDQFIQQANYGAGLYIAYQLDFVSWDAKVNFMLEADFVDLLGIGNIYYMFLEIQLALQTSGSLGAATLFAYQLGGNDTALEAIFDENLGGFFATVCLFSNLTPCELAINKTLDYSVNNFPFQINMTTDGEYVGNVVTTSYTYLPYTILGLETGQSQVTDSIAETRSSLSDLFYSLHDLNSFAGHILSSWVPKYMSSDVVNYMNATSANITSNIAMLTNNETGYITCYTNITNCMTNAAHLLNKLHHVDEGFVNDFTEAIQLQYVYCGNFNVGDISGVAIPLGNNNYIKTQNSKYTEFLQITYDDNSMTIVEPNIGNGMSFKMALVADQTGSYYGNATFANGCMVQCIGYVIDNPI